MKDLFLKEYRSFWPLTLVALAAFAFGAAVVWITLFGEADSGQATAPDPVVRRVSVPGTQNLGSQGGRELPPGT